MADPRMEKLAATLVDYCVAVKPGDWVVINGHVLALPLVDTVVQNVLAAGGHPTVMLNDDGLEETFLAQANESQLRWGFAIRGNHCCACRLHNQHSRCKQHACAQRY